MAMEAESALCLSPMAMRMELQSYCSASSSHGPISGTPQTLHEPCLPSVRSRFLDGQSYGRRKTEANRMDGGRQSLIPWTHPIFPQSTHGNTRDELHAAGRSFVTRGVESGRAEAADPAAAEKLPEMGRRSNVRPIKIRPVLKPSNDPLHRASISSPKEIYSRYMDVMILKDSTKQKVLSNSDKQISSFERNKKIKTPCSWPTNF